MWIVRLALRRPYTFIVMAILIAIMGGLSIVTTPTDIFPYINIPMVGVIWTYTGMSPDDMARRVLFVSERAMTTTVNNIERIEATAYNGVGLIRVYMQQGTNVDLAVAQVTAVSQTLLRTMPPGIFPPLIVQTDASSVPILQLGLSSGTLTEQQLYDYGQNFIRTRLATIPGISVPLPYGGKVREVMVDLDPDALYGKGLSATDISNALDLQNLILPTGTVKVGTREYLIRLNSSPELISAMNDMPIKTVNGAPVYMRDVGQVRDGYQVQTNMVRINGGLSSLLTVLRHGGASTLAVVQGVKDLLPKIQATLPPSLNITQLFDQSLFVRAAVQGVVREASIAALLTALMILLFLGSWRSTLIVCISIPLSILTSLTVLGLARADDQRDDAGRVGSRRRNSGGRCDGGDRKRPSQHGNQRQDAGSRDSGRRARDRRAGFCFHALHLHCLRSGAHAIRRGEIPVYAAGDGRGVRDVDVVSADPHRGADAGSLPAAIGDRALSGGRGRRHAGRKVRGRYLANPSGFRPKFEKFRAGYHRLLEWVLAHRAITGGAFLAFALASIGLVAVVGQNFFPYVDAGQMRLHVRPPPVRASKKLRPFSRPSRMRFAV